MAYFFSHRRVGFSVFFTLLLFFSLTLVLNAQETEDEEPDAIAIFNRGQDAHEKGDLETALKLYDEAIKLAPDFPEAEFQKGNALLSLGKTVEAEKAFRRALEIREDWTLAMTSLGVLLVEKNKFAEAELFLTKAVEDDELNFAAYTALTDLRLKTKAKTEVLKELLTKIQFLTSKANASAAVWAARSALENALGDRAAAKTSINRALLLEPNNKNALVGRVEISLTEGEFISASKDISTLAKNSPNSTTVKFLQARLLAGQGKTDEAVKILDTIENSAEVASLKKNILSGGSENIAELEKELETDAKNGAVLGRLCALLRADNPVKALEYCKRASEAEPNNLNHVIGFAAALVQAKRFDDAVIVLQRILQVAPQNATAHANLATAFFQLKRFEEAKKEYLWLTEYQPDAPIAYFFLAIAQDSLGEYGEALASYRQFLKVADANQNKLEIEKVNLRLPALEKQAKQNGGKKGKKQ